MKLKCKNCGVDMKKDGVTYVEDGCSNYINYTFDKKDGWYVDSETNGDDPTESYYTCRQCGETVTDTQQEYLEENI